MFKFHVTYNSRKALKEQLFIDFIAKMTRGTLELAHTWVVFIDGSSNNHGSGTRLILENKVGLMIEVSMCFYLFMTNNQFEYEEVIACFILANKMGVENARLRMDSQLKVS